jgi:DNA-binding NarL/FixJ family response regulator
MASPASTVALPTTFSPSPRLGDANETFPAVALSSRERDVLLLVAEGWRDQEIVGRLFLSHHTVANHVRNILGKLGVSSRAAAVAQAARSGLL